MRVDIQRHIYTHAVSVVSEIILSVYLHFVVSPSCLTIGFFSPEDFPIKEESKMAALGSIGAFLLKESTPPLGRELSTHAVMWTQETHVLIVGLNRVMAQ